ncbi:hypothetical protein LINPERPRIM_LOCUS8700 [Linum perenne]
MAGSGRAHGLIISLVLLFGCLFAIHGGTLSVQGYDENEGKLSSMTLQYGVRVAF